MSQYYDNYHRWEPLAEFHFDLNAEDELDEDNYLYCLCSRAYIRDGVKTYNIDKEDGSESEVEVRDQTQEWDEHSHVHFSLDTSYKVKCEKDEGASCYCSASHTDNCCSTDEHDAQIHSTHALQPSDSGADLTYQDGHSEYTNPEKLERRDQDSTENYLTEDTWDKFWAIHGERLIWASWIKKYSDYINPAYLDDNKDLTFDENSIPKQKSVDQIFKEDQGIQDDDSEIRERKFSYDSKVNPYKKVHNQNQEKIDRDNESWLGRRRSCSEHERIVSPRTLAGTDSMTNVTKITLSSYDVTSSHVTSESTPTDDYSVSSNTSDEQNDQTRIANLENDPSVNEMDTDQYWQVLWKKHFGEQYALHYANYIETHAEDRDVPIINVEQTTIDITDGSVVNIDKNYANVDMHEASIDTNKVDNTKDSENPQEKVLDIECENSEGNSQELPTVIEVQIQVEDMKIQETKPKKRGKKKSNKYLGSVGVLLQSLLKDELSVESTDTGEGSLDNSNKNNDIDVKDNVVESNSSNINIQQSISNTNFTSYSYDDGDDDPPEDTPVNLKRSHELDYEEAASEKIKATFEVMGFSIKDNNIPKGQMVYRKRLNRLRPPRYKKFGAPKKTYFDEDGNPVQADQNIDSEEKEMQTNDDYHCPDFRAEALRLLNSIIPDDKDNSNQNNTEATKSDNDLDNNKEIQGKVSETIDDFNMSIDVNDYGNENIVEQSTDDKTEKISQINTENTQKVNEKENKNNSNNKSLTNQIPEEKSNEKEISNKNAKDTEMNVDSKDSEPKDLIEIKSNDDTENSKETKDESKDFDSYDVQNKGDNYVNDSIGLEASEVPLPDDLDQSSDNENEKLDVENTVPQNVESTKRRRRQKRYAKLDDGNLTNIPEELRDDPKMMKYWKKRHSLFHRFDSGIRLDRESWFSVTPESVARHIARKCQATTVIDAFCGAAGNTIQFAMVCEKVIAIDIDPAKIELARHNAEVYGVSDRIQFIVGDFFELAPSLEADMVFLSPPWGGPGYSSNAQYDIETMLLPKPASELMQVARTISHSVCLYLPRNTRPDQILSLAKNVGGSVEVEQSYLDKRFVAITAYYY